MQYLAWSGVVTRAAIAKSNVMCSKAMFHDWTELALGRLTYSRLVAATTSLITER